jgi:hypothetical protein
MSSTGNSIALGFALPIVLTPMATLAQSSPYPTAHVRTIHQHVRRTRNDARLARPAINQPTQASPPAISRDPNDCVKTACTCLGGGDC